MSNVNDFSFIKNTIQNIKFDLVTEYDLGDAVFEILKHGNVILKPESLDKNGFFYDLSSLPAGKYIYRLSFDKQVVQVGKINVIPSLKDLEKE
jgi:hypothetical protein